MGTGLPPTEISHDQKPPVMRVSHLIPDMRAPCVCLTLFLARTLAPALTSTLADWLNPCQQAS